MSVEHVAVFQLVLEISGLPAPVSDEYQKRDIGPPIPQKLTPRAQRQRVVLSNLDRTGVKNVWSRHIVGRQHIFYFGWLERCLVELFSEAHAVYFAGFGTARENCLANIPRGVLGVAQIEIRGGLQRLQPFS